jgi:cell division protein FtsQ
MWKKRIITACWILLGVATIVLLAAAMQVKSAKHCNDVVIEIDGVEEHLFVDEKEVLAMLNKTGELKGQPIAAINLRNLEGRLEKNPWIQNAELFFDNKLVLQVKLRETEPIARIFTLSGSSYYIDSAAKHLPLSDVVSARVPMFTSFPSDNVVLSVPDSAVLQDVKHIAAFIKKDSFWMAQVAQIDITPKRTYQLIPVLGNQVIELGNAEDIEKKFNRLFAFYKNVWAKSGFEKYASIDVQYEGQIVATRKGVGSPAEDSVKAMMLLNNTIDKVNAMVADSLLNAANKPTAAMDAAHEPKIVLTNESMPAENNVAVTAPVKNDAAVINKIKNDLKKNAPTKTVNKKSPKAVMKKK